MTRSLLAPQLLGQPHNTVASVASLLGVSPSTLSNNVRSVDWWTDADGRVCKRCHAIESANPYPLVEAPIPALHPFCRCVLMPHDPLDPLRLAGYAVT